jgi:hypothetical protein
MWEPRKGGERLRSVVPLRGDVPSAGSARTRSATDANATTGTCTQRLPAPPLPPSPSSARVGGRASPGIQRTRGPFGRLL